MQFLKLYLQLTNILTLNGQVISNKTLGPKEQQRTLAL